MENNLVPGAPLTFQQAVQRVLSKYAEFNGRASRSEFWWFMLFVVCVGVVFSLLTAITGLRFFAWIGQLCNLALLVPTLAVSWRRLHDVGRAGGWWFINFVPVVGAILFILWTVKPSEPVANRFGEVPAN